MKYERYVIDYVFDVDGLTAREALSCDAAGLMQAVQVTSVELGAMIAREYYTQSTLAEIADQPMRSYRLRSLTPYVFRDVEP